MKKAFIIHGPNLNCLGKREPALYGSMTLKEVNALLVREGKKLRTKVIVKQSNAEGEIVDWLQALQKEKIADTGLIINPGGYTHTSVAIRDALSMLSIPILEVHLSNIYAREPFRQKSLISPVVRGTITGLGPHGYLLALHALSRLWDGPTG